VGAAFLFVHRPGGLTPDDDAHFERTAAAFPSRIRGFVREDERGRDARLALWSREGGRFAGVTRGDDDWLAVVGNPTHAALAGLKPADARQWLLATANADGLDAVSPPFAWVHHRGGGQYDVGVDRAGLQHVYRREARGSTWLSTSALPLADGAAVDPAALAEWLAIGHFVTTRTLVAGVEKVPAARRIALGPKGETVHAGPLPAAGAVPDDPLGTYTEAFLAATRTCAADDGVQAELTGGLDTRLLLASVLSQDLPVPTWTISQRGSDELRTIDRLRSVEPFEHVVADVPETFADELPGLALELHELSDGEVNAIEYAPLLLAFRGAQSVGRRVSMSGGGGEIARGFYFSAVDPAGGGVRGVSLERLLAKLTASTAGVARAIRPEVVREPDASVAETVRSLLLDAPGDSPEAVLEHIYLNSRMQRLAGRNSSTTGVFYRQAVPFFANDFVDLQLSLPPAWKHGSLVMRRAIERLHPRLARVPLDTGLPVAPLSWRRPSTHARRVVSYGRRGLVKFGGTPGALLARRPPKPVPWHAAQTSATFREFVGDHLETADARVLELVDGAAVRAHVERAFATGDFYPAGLLLALELTLRRMRT
jgi:asparagine synthase (glutamine-hydrolysing)